MPYLDGFYYSDTGVINNNKTQSIIFIHGFFMDGRMFEKQVTYFSNFFRVICCDIRGFGFTKWIKKPFTLNDIVNDIHFLIKKLKLHKPIISGMSMGGYIALRLALQYPDCLSKLILISTQADKDNPETVQSYQSMINTWHIAEERRNSIKTLLPIMFGSEADNALLSFWADIWSKYSYESLVYPMASMVNRNSISICSINLPTMIIHGDADVGIPIDAAYSMKNNLVNSEIKVIKQGHHAVSMTHSKEVNKAIYKFYSK